MRRRGKRSLTPEIILAAWPGAVREHRFHPVRRWRFDYAWPERKIAFEVEGGTWFGGRHSRGKGYRSDCEKYSTAAIHGWMVLRATSDMMRDGSAVTFLEMAHKTVREGRT